MTDKRFIFVAGVHRSGTSLLYRLLRGHKDISGFYNTGVPEDEGQHLQSVFPPAKTFGGPGAFALHPDAYMDENHPLATEENARKIYTEWARHLDTNKAYLAEKSPPNIIRMRFLQQLFPNSYFIVILRHPIAVAYATKRWSDKSTFELVSHTLVAYDRCIEDMRKLHNVYMLHYEKLVENPQQVMDGICRFLSLEKTDIQEEIKHDINRKYLAYWEEEKRTMDEKEKDRFYRMHEVKMNRFGYTLDDPYNLKTDRGSVWDR